jgi:hypothetical protein
VADRLPCFLKCRHGQYRQIKDQLFPHLQSWGAKLGNGWEFGDCWGRKLVPKKSLPHSPNRSDVMAMLFWQMPEFEVLTASPPDTSDFLSITRQRREREEYAGSTWDE